MTEVIHEYVDSRGVTLDVDEEAGVLRGVKLIGLSSQNGRAYREAALVAAASLYEGAKVNVNHCKQGPHAPRDYQDRLGVIRRVEHRAGEGLFGELHFNPKHALAEQLVWDARNNPSNVGFSHNVRARAARDQGIVTVDEITQVQSVDLVADPAATRGLFEHVDAASPDDESWWEDLTLESLNSRRPDLGDALASTKMEQLEAELAELRANDRRRRQEQRIAEILSEYETTSSQSTVGLRERLGQAFFETLLDADADQLRQLIAERSELLRRTQRQAARPRSAEQNATAVALESATTAKQFARAIRSAPQFSSRRRGPSREPAAPLASPQRRGHRRQQPTNRTRQPPANLRRQTMPNTMRWRYGDTHPVMATPASADLIEIGDLVYQEIGVAKPASSQTDQGTLVANQSTFHQNFLGVAMQSSPVGADAPIRVATSGVFQFGCATATFELGDPIGAAEDVGGTALQDQQVEAAGDLSLAIGRCASRVSPAAAQVLVEIVSTILRGGPQAAE